MRLLVTGTAYESDQSGTANIASPTSNCNRLLYVMGLIEPGEV